MRKVRKVSYINSATNNSVSKIVAQAKEAQKHLQQAYDILDVIGDYTDALIDWSLVENLQDLINNIDEVIDM